VCASVCVCVCVCVQGGPVVTFRCVASVPLCVASVPVDLFRLVASVFFFFFGSFLSLPNPPRRRIV